VEAEREGESKSDNMQIHGQKEGESDMEMK
jgi:hypothetical protein